jgi:hypothetical protein
MAGQVFCKSVPGGDDFSPDYRTLGFSDGPALGIPNGLGTRLTPHDNYSNLSFKGTSAGRPVLIRCKANCYCPGKSPNDLFSSLAGARGGPAGRR